VFVLSDHGADEVTDDVYPSRCHGRGDAGSRGAAVRGLRRSV